MTHTEPTAASGGEPLDRLRQWLAGEDQLQRRLGTIIDPSRFAASLCEAGRAAGLDVPQAAVAQVLRPDPLGVARWQAAPVNPSGWPSAGWFPSRSVLATAPADGPGGGAAQATLHIDWAWQGAARLDQPFYEDSVRHAAALPLSQFLRARTGLDALLRGWQAEPQPVAPAGLVFHLSRCGSTLLARMLQRWPSCHAASEPEPLDAVIQWASAAPLPLADKVALLRAMAAAIGRNRRPGEQRFFIKLDCWHMLALPLLRAAFPGTPWLFLYRDPLEIAVSQLAMPGIQMVPGMLGSAILGIAGGEHMPAEAYVARVLGRICEAAARHGPGDGGLFVDYRDLATAMQGAIPAHFGLPVDEHTPALLESLGRVSAKDPGKIFTPDSEAKRTAATNQLKDHVLIHATPWYHRLNYQSSATHP